MWVCGGVCMWEGGDVCIRVGVNTHTCMTVGQNIFNHNLRQEGPISKQKLVSSSLK